VAVHAHLRIRDHLIVPDRPGISHVYGCSPANGPAHCITLDVSPQSQPRSIPDVVPGWANAFWQIMQFLIVTFAFTHAANGLRMFAEDYIGHTFWQPFFRAFLALIWIAMLIIAFYVINGSAY
jgi:succinate dehydrogenase hydrophobic anchor subunit